MVTEGRFSRRPAIASLLEGVTRSWRTLISVGFARDGCSRAVFIAEVAVTSHSKPSGARRRFEQLAASLHAQPSEVLVPHACRIGHQLRESVGLLDNEGGDALHKGLLAVTQVVWCLGLGHCLGCSQLC